MEPSELGVQGLYEFLVGTVQPRPIALVSSESSDREPNLAPFSFFMVGGVNPPSLVFCPSANGRGEDKTTLRNIESTGEYVVNWVARDIAHQVGQAGTSQAGKWELTGLTPVASEQVRPARVGESLIQAECRLHQVVRHGAGPFASIYVIGEIVRLHVEPEILRAPGLFQPIVRMGGPQYLDLDGFEIFELEAAKPTPQTS